MNSNVKAVAYATAIIQAGSVGGVTWARRQRTIIQAMNGLRMVFLSTWTRVSSVRWWDHGFRGEDVERVLFDVIFGGEEDMLNLILSYRSMFV
jgi:hypothetical protein